MIIRLNGAPNRYLRLALRRPLSPNWERIGLLAVNFGLWALIALMIRLVIVKGL